MRVREIGARDERAVGEREASRAETLPRGGLRADLSLIDNRYAEAGMAIISLASVGVQERLLYYGSRA